jgi:hypothetical protein
MRRALIVGAAMVLVAGAGLVVVLRGGPGAGRASERGSLPARTAAAGGVEVTVEPVRIDGGGAVFLVAFDTHSVELELDPATGARLRVGSRDWGPSTWEGDGPGGHHRNGRLTFPPGGPASGDVRLTIEGLPGPVELTWQQVGR